MISCQQIDPFDLYCALNEGYNNKDFLSSGFLPEHCLSVAMNGSERYFVLWNPELRADLTYLNTEYRTSLPPAGVRYPHAEHRTDRGVFHRRCSG